VARLHITLLSETFAGRKFRGFVILSQNRDIKFREIVKKHFSPVKITKRIFRKYKELSIAN